MWPGPSGPRAVRHLVLAWRRVLGKCGAVAPSPRRLAVAALALTDVLAGVPDPRSRHGRVHPLGAVLGLVVLGLLMGKRSLSGIARLGRNYGPALAHALGFRRGKTPAKSTLSEILRATEAAAVEEALSRWVGSRLPPNATRIALDGRPCAAAATASCPASTCWPPTSPRSRRCWPRCASMPRPTNTRPPCGCWASCLWRARW